MLKAFLTNAAQQRQEDTMAFSPTSLDLRCWGVRGSVPTPLAGADVEAKVRDVLQRALSSREFSSLSAADLPTWIAREIPFASRSTMGGNTSCVDVRAGDARIILDMGTGIRPLGCALMGDVLRTRRLHGVVLGSHVHWDHIQGFPFWKQVYLPRQDFDVAFDLCGGRAWDKSLEQVLQGQMNAPEFPVDFRELDQIGMRMRFETVYDRWTKVIEGGLPVTVLARKLNHPQETYGFRISVGGRVVAYTTDHEPYAGGLPRGLVELVRDADLWITDCQYSHAIYTGADGGPQRTGWGHSYPEYIAEIASAAKPHRVLTFHHDPEASDEHIFSLARRVEELSGIPTEPAYEGLAFSLSLSAVVGLPDVA